MNKQDDRTIVDRELYDALNSLLFVKGWSKQDLLREVYHKEKISNDNPIFNYSKFDIATILVKGYRLSYKDEFIDWYDSLSDTAIDSAYKEGVLRTLKLLNMKIEGVNLNE